MDKKEITSLLERHKAKRPRTIVVVDFGNVDKWKESLGWKVGIQELAQLIKHFSYGKSFYADFIMARITGQMNAP